MLSTRKPEEPNFNFNHVRGLQEALGEPPWTGPGPWARGPGPSSSKHRHEIRVGGVPLDVENADGHAAGSWTGVRVAWRAVRSHTPVSGDTQIWVASSNAILEPLRPSASRRSGRIFTQPA